MKLKDILEARNPLKRTHGLDSVYNYQQALAMSKKRGTGVIEPTKVTQDDNSVRMAYVDQGTGEIYYATDLE